MKMINNEYIIQIKDFVIGRKRIYIYMEYASGGTLKNYNKKNK